MSLEESNEREYVTVAKLVTEARSGKKGSAEAFGTLHERFQAGVRLRVQRLVPCGSDIDEATQRVWLAAHRKLKDVRDPQAFSKWLMSIAHSEAYKVRKSRDRKQEVSLSDLRGTGIAVPEIYDREPEPIDALIDKEKKWTVRGGIMRLPPDKRMPMWKFHFKGMSIDEIVRLKKKEGGKGNSRSTVLTRLREGKANLKRFLESVNLTQ